MPQLLLEFFSEEIPARMQARAEQDLERLLMDKLTGAGFLPEGVKAFSTPRRLVAVAEGLPERQPDTREERKGPRVGSPEKAIEGFLRGAGLSSIDQAKTVDDPKGGYYLAVIEKKGRATTELVAEIVPEIARAFPWPKSMRWGNGDLYWVRPLQSVLCAFDGEAVKVDLAGVPSGRSTEGHRFHAPGRFEVRRFDDYRAALMERYVILEREERKAQILAEARTLCQARNLELVEDPGLLEEVAGLAEWPVVLMGDMDPAFLDLPGEVIRLTMRTHQRYFAVRDPRTGKLAPHFITMANVEAEDGGKAIAAGNARVLSARLNDARFFWDLDKRKGLEDPERIAKLDSIVFHQKLGSIGDKVQRIEALAVKLAAIVGADVKLVRRAAHLCKADLVAETVGEFPELQGQIGRELYEGTKGASPSIAAAIEDHYRPLGPNDRVPVDPVATTIALADKLDSLVGFWSIGERPTGSSDTYALRRAGLGLVRIVLDQQIRLPLLEAILTAMGILAGRDFGRSLFEQTESAFSGNMDIPEHIRLEIADILSEKRIAILNNQIPAITDACYDLAGYLIDRLQQQLEARMPRKDIARGCFDVGDDDLVRLVRRVDSVEAFLKTEDGKNLLAGYKRAANILAAEAKKGKALTEQDLASGVKRDLLQEPAEIALHQALGVAAPAAKAAVEKEDFAGAMKALAGLRGPVDAFFGKVLVNAPDEMLRRNRLLLLSQIRDGLHAVADFSKIEG